MSGSIEVLGSKFEILAERIRYLKFVKFPAECKNTSDLHRDNFQIGP
jgi:hypothetical protein